MMMEPRSFSLVKPSVHTPFHIDFGWWKQTDHNWRIYLLSCLCPEHQQVYNETHNDELIDWVDPETAEVQYVDILQHTLITHCARREDFLPEHTALVDAVFKTLLANGNSPMTPAEMGALLRRPPETILRTLSGQHVYQGIRPVQK